MASDVFPPTLATWIDEQYRQGPDGQRLVTGYLMQTYAWPLKVYYLGTNSRWLGDPDDVIGGFFASRLGQEDFIPKWQQSGKPLRRWLINAFWFYLKELRRGRRSREQPLGEGDEQITFSGDPDAAVDRASIVAFVRQAMEDAARACDEAGLDEHWRVFVRHQIDGIAFRDLGEEFGVDAARAAVMSRTATRKFRAALHDVLARDGIAPENINSEIQLLLEVAGS